MACGFTSRLETGGQEESGSTVTLGSYLGPLEVGCLCLAGNASKRNSRVNASQHAIPICLKSIAPGVSPLRCGHCLLCLARPSSLVFVQCPRLALTQTVALSFSLCMDPRLKMPTMLWGRKPPWWNAWARKRPGPQQ